MEDNKIEVKDQAQEKDANANGSFIVSAAIVVGIILMVIVISVLTVMTKK